MRTEQDKLVQEIVRLYRSLPEEFQKQVMDNIGNRKIKVYKMLHKPTGLFYKPVKGYDSNLGLSGKVYSRRPQLPGSLRIHIRGGLHKEGSVTSILIKHFKIKGYADQYFKSPDSEWEIIEY